MYNFNDFKLVVRSNRTVRLYSATCDTCGCSLGYILKTKKTFLKCRRCGHIGKHYASPDTRHKMSIAKRGVTPWNRGTTVSDEVKNKISASKQGSIPHNKGKSMTEDQRIKISCTLRDIAVDEFDDFTKDADDRQRILFDESGLRQEAFQRDGYRCIKCRQHKAILNVHHIMSWKFNPGLRMSISNLVTLCYDCHKEFHRTYGNGMKKENTRDQFEEFLDSDLVFPGFE